MENLGIQNIEDVDTSNFMEKVIKGSKNKPVIVDFWAPWCNPCKQLTPILEENIKKFPDHVKLAKINIDENQDLAQQMRIESVPTVLAFYDGKPVNGFAGLKDSTEISTFINEIIELGKHSNDEVQEINNLLEKAEKNLEENNFEEAIDVFSSLLAESLPKAEMLRAIVGLGKSYLGLNKFDELNNLLEQLEDDIKNSKEVEDLMKSKKYLEGINPKDISFLEEQIKIDKNNLETRYELARNFIATKRYQEAVDNLLYIIEIKKDWKEGIAKKELLELFSLLGNNNTITMEGRSRLSNLIFK